MASARDRARRARFPSTDSKELQSAEHLTGVEGTSLEYLYRSGAPARSSTASFESVTAQPSTRQATRLQPRGAAEREGISAALDFIHDADEQAINQPMGTEPKNLMHLNGEEGVSKANVSTQSPFPEYRRVKVGEILEEWGGDDGKATNGGKSKSWWPKFNGAAKNKVTIQGHLVVRDATKDPPVMVLGAGPNHECPYKTLGGFMNIDRSRLNVEDVTTMTRDRKATLTHYTGHVHAVGRTLQQGDAFGQRLLRKFFALPTPSGWSSTANFPPGTTETSSSQSMQDSPSTPNTQKLKTTSWSTADPTAKSEGSTSMVRETDWAASGRGVSAIYDPANLDGFQGVSSPTRNRIKQPRSAVDIRNHAQASRTELDLHDPHSPSFSNSYQSVLREPQGVVPPPDHSGSHVSLPTEEIRVSRNDDGVSIHGKQSKGGILKPKSSASRSEQDRGVFTTSPHSPPPIPSIYKTKGYGTSSSTNPPVSPLPGQPPIPVPPKLAFKSQSKSTESLDSTEILASPKAPSMTVPKSEQRMKSTLPKHYRTRFPTTKSPGLPSDPDDPEWDIAIAYVKRQMRDMEAEEQRKAREAEKEAKRTPEDIAEAERKVKIKAGIELIKRSSKGGWVPILEDYMMNSEQHEAIGLALQEKNMTAAQHLKAMFKFVGVKKAKASLIKAAGREAEATKRVKLNLAANATKTSLNRSAQQDEPDVSPSFRTNSDHSEEDYQRAVRMLEGDLFKQSPQRSGGLVQSNRPLQPVDITGELHTEHPKPSTLFDLMVDDPEINDTVRVSPERAAEYFGPPTPAKPGRKKVAHPAGFFYDDNSDYEEPTEEHAKALSRLCNPTVPITAPSPFGFGTGEPTEKHEKAPSRLCSPSVPITTPSPVGLGIGEPTKKHGKAPSRLCSPSDLITAPSPIDFGIGEPTKKRGKAPSRLCSPSDPITVPSPIGLGIGVNGDQNLPLDNGNVISSGTNFRTYDCPSSPSPRDDGPRAVFNDHGTPMVKVSTSPTIPRQGTHFVPARTPSFRRKIQEAARTRALAIGGSHPALREKAKATDTPPVPTNLLRTSTSQPNVRKPAVTFQVPPVPPIPSQYAPNVISVTPKNDLHPLPLKPRLRRRPVPLDINPRSVTAPVNLGESGAHDKSTEMSGQYPKRISSLVPPPTPRLESTPVMPELENKFRDTLARWQAASSSPNGGW